MQSRRMGERELQKHRDISRNLTTDSHHTRRNGNARTIRSNQHFWIATKVSFQFAVLALGPSWHTGSLIHLQIRWRFACANFRNERKISPQRKVRFCVWWYFTFAPSLIERTWPFSLLVLVHMFSNELPASKRSCSSHWRQTFWLPPTSRTRAQGSCWASEWISNGYLIDESLIKLFAGTKICGNSTRN